MNMHKGNVVRRWSRICGTILIINAATSLYANVLTVTSLADSGPGSLRDQVAVSAAGDTIQFAVTGNILLASAITINHTLWIQGPGAASLAVDANHVDRAFVAVASSGTVFLSGMTISNGFVAGLDGPDASNPGQNGGPGLDAYGGAILSYSDELDLSNCWVKGNTVQAGHGGFGGPNPAGAVFTPGRGGQGGMGAGGGLYATNKVILVNCTFSDNRAVGGRGGVGGTNYNPAVNEPGGLGGTGGPGQGGAVNLVNGVAKGRQFQNSTFSANRAGGGAGGQGGDSLDGPGGQGGDGGQAGGGAIATLLVDLFSCTIVSNSAIGGVGGLAGSGTILGANGTTTGGTGGGVIGYIITCQSEIENTILADNFASGSYSNYFIAMIDLGFNFLGTDDQLFCSALQPTTRVGNNAIPLHPQLGPLAQNGGGTPTHATTLTSPVTDAGTAFPFFFDERGAPRPYDFNAIPNIGDGSDIGAFELGSPDVGLGMSGTNLVISWPAFYGDFLLEGSVDAQSPNSWSAVSNPPVQIGTMLVVTNGMAAPQMFYRLIK